MGGDKEEKLTCCQKLGQGCLNFGNFLYRRGTDKEGNEVGLVIGRSCKSWARIGLFYLGFYGFLAGFFSAMLIVFLTTINPADKTGLNKETAGPKLTQFLAHPELEVAPGLNWVNQLGPLKNYDNNKTIAESKRREKFLNETRDYLEGFEYTPSVACPKGEEGYTADVPCKPNMNFSSQCRPEDGYGYDTKKPCLFVKINKVWGWVPMADGSEYLKLECTSDKDTVIESTGDQPGFQKSAFPFFGQKPYHTPPAVVIIDLNNKVPIDKNVRCKLKGKGVVPSESFNPSRAFGAIELKIPCLDPECEAAKE